MPEEHDSNIQDSYEKWAGIYDMVLFPLAGIRKKVVDFTGAPPGAEVLDVATGTGIQAVAFARQGYRVTGIDVSEEMLKIARLNNRYDNLKFLAGDAASLPFGDNSFDVTTVSLALHEMPLSAREKVIAEMARVTRKGGIITVVDFALPRGKMAKKIAYAAIKSFESEHYPGFIKSDLPALLEKSGFKIEAERRVFFGIGRILKGIKAG